MRKKMSNISLEYCWLAMNAEVKMINKIKWVKIIAQNIFN